MMLKVSLTTRADRNYSGDSYTVSHDNLEKGIYVEQLFPEYQQLYNSQAHYLQQLSQLQHEHYLLF